MKTFKTIIYSILALCLYLPCTLLGQGFQTANDTIPSARVEGMPLPKGLEINYQRLSGANIRSVPVSGGFVNEEARIDGAAFLQFQLKIPLILRPGTSLLLGFDYNERHYSFERPLALESSVLREIEQENLKSREITFYYNKALNRKAFISARMDFALNGDLEKLSESRFTGFLRYTAGVVYGWQPHSRLAHGIGVFFNYSLGRPSVLPVFIWNKTINDRWGIEAKIPANFKFRRDFSPNSRLYMGYAIDGASYVINGRFEPLSNFRSAELRRADIALELNYEQRIYDFIWMNAGIGYSYNINLRVSEENNFSNESLLKNEVDPSILFSVSLFIVPTEGLKDLFGF